MERSRPKVILSAGMSIDGKIATSTGESKLSSKDDIKRVHKLRSKVDAVLIGRNTMVSDNPLLTVRHVKGKNPKRIVISSSGRIPINSKIVKTAAKIPTMVVCSNKITQKNKKHLEDGGIEVLVSGNNSINLKKLLSVLYKKKIRSILLEGGGHTNWEFFQQNLIDEIFITVTPFVLGGQNSISLVGGRGFPKISNSPKFSLKKVDRLKDELVLHYAKL